jgi:hypothetical protein
LTKPIVGKEFSFFNTSLRIQRLQLRAIAQGYLAIQPQLKFPTARGDVGNGRFEFSAAAPFLVNLPAKFHLGVQPGISYERNSRNTEYATGFPLS